MPSQSFRAALLAAALMEPDADELRPIPAGQLGGKATVLAAGKSQAVAMAPGDANSPTGKPPTVSGKAAHARSASGQQPPLH